MWYAYGVYFRHGGCVTRDVIPEILHAAMGVVGGRTRLRGQGALLLRGLCLVSGSLSWNTYIWAADSLQQQARNKQVLLLHASTEYLATDDDNDDDDDVDDENEDNDDETI